MARLARVVAVGEPHHLTQRGNNRLATFLDDHDRTRYCRLLRERSACAGMRLLGYCLMTNRDHLGTALRYVDLNPARAGIVDNATDYEWSSARSHVEGRDRLGLLDLDLWKEVSRGQDWRDALARSRDGEAAEMAALRHATRTGRPLGGDGFVKRLEVTFGRKLNTKRTGRSQEGPSGNRRRKVVACPLLFPYFSDGTLSPFYWPHFPTSLHSAFVPFNSPLALLALGGDISEESAEREVDLTPAGFSNATAEEEQTERCFAHDSGGAIRKNFGAVKKCIAALPP
jgi:putative transposase